MSNNNNKQLGEAPWLHVIISTGLGTGFVPKAPGTAGAFLALLIWIGLYYVHFVKQVIYMLSTITLAILLVWIEKIIYGNIQQGDDLIKSIEAGVLSSVFKIHDGAWGDMKMYQDERKLDFHALGREIKRKRESKGWTQEYLAQLVDRTPRSITLCIENLRTLSK